MPTIEQRRPVLSIDLGASHTKVAWRRAWSEEVQRFESPSEGVMIDESFLIPSIAYDPGNGADWVFGRSAAGITPGPNGRLYQDWKSHIYDEQASKQKSKEVLEVATRFFRWLRDKLKASCPTIAEAHTRICVPAFESGKTGRKILMAAMEKAGWNDSGMLLTVTEPKANVIGLASAGCNCVNRFRGELHVVLPNVYGRHSPLMLAAKQAVLFGLPGKRLCVIDIGAFTTDVAVCQVTDEIKILVQKSFRHGVSRLDGELMDLIKAKGFKNILSLNEFDGLKKTVYGMEPYLLKKDEQKIAFEENCMESALERFSEELLTHAKPHLTNVDWFVLTGGGSLITLVNKRLRKELEAKEAKKPGTRKLWPVQDFFPAVDLQTATALGGSSVVLDFYEPVTPTHTSAPIEFPSGMIECSCGGNQDCLKCGGSGLREATQRPKPSHASSENIEHKQETGVSPEDKSHLVTRDNQTDIKRPEVDIGKPLPTVEQITPYSRPTPTPKEIEKESVDAQLPISVKDLIECWRGESVAATREFCLEGWMGDLVFDGVLSIDEKRRCLIATESPEGKSAWLKLLCLCTCFGIRGHPKTVRQFWNEKLPPIWQALIPSESENGTLLPATSKGRITRLLSSLGMISTSTDVVTRESDPAVLDAFFEKAIHRQFRDENASGEDGELWRRVFYDFRKIHFFVYQNDLPSVFAELKDNPDFHWDSMVRFLKSGFLPNGQKRWVGVFGQSMTAPLLLLMRMLRRLDVIDHKRFDPACFYMNGPARRVARRLGWITERESNYFEIEALLDMSRRCHEAMQKEAPELAPFFDIPLQWYALRNPRS